MPFAPYLSHLPLYRAASALLCLSIALGVHAQQVAPAIQTHALQAHVTFLADDLLDGRAAASRGYEIAAKYVAAQLQQHCGDKLYRTVIPRNGRLAEAPSHGLPALGLEKSSKGAQAYLALAGEMLNRAVAGA